MIYRADALALKIAVPIRVGGIGPKTAKIAFFGEALGLDEQRLGEPFVGKAGKRFDAILANTGIIRSDVYISMS